MAGNEKFASQALDALAHILQTIPFSPGSRLSGIKPAAVIFDDNFDFGIRGRDLQQHLRSSSVLEDVI